MKHVSSVWELRLGFVIPWTYWIWYLQARQRPRDWEALIRVYLLVTLAAFVWVEIMSAIDAFSITTTLCFWIGLGGLGSALWVRRRPKLFLSRGAFDPLSILVVFFLLVSFVAGWFFAPNNWDGIVYHLPRVLLWIQEQGIDLKVSHDLRQIAFGPLAEIFIAQFMLLSGNEDSLAFAPQWFSFVVILLTISWYFRSRYGAIEACAGVLFVVSAPLVLLQSHSVQNDLFLAVFVLFGVLLVADDAPNSLQRSVFLAIASVLAFLTKGTGFIFFAPLLITYLIRLREEQPVEWRHHALCFILPMVALVPWALRNWSSFGHPLGPPEITRNLAVDMVSVSGAAANVLRNLSLHLATPFTGLNEWLEGGVRSFVSLLGEDMSSRDWIHKGNWRFPRFVFDEDEGGNILQVAVLIAALIRVGIFWGRMGKSTRLIVLLWLGQVILFCGLLKWQFWNGRLHTPLFVLGGLIVPTVVGGDFRTRRWLLWGLTFCALGVWGLVSWSNTMRPLSALGNVQRERSYFQMAPDQYHEYLGLTRVILTSGCESVAVDWGREVFEYPLRFFVFRQNPNVRFQSPGEGEPPCLWLRIGRVNDVESADLAADKVLWKSPRAVLHE